ncbi:hypothetical protein EV702DRAFT_1067407 [Suillus placidus]|uniref:D-isomer specific 2-hydroxyacid dehydrogenase NAD-binding domain-containing protein n=1 Tax=Suillus placidus TaxID=48579 RepID=A0A9P7A3P0_9AGAM|nr:hypothetical protein EV702DRAFT_1067407 [Suillus placidus]
MYFPCECYIIRGPGTKRPQWYEYVDSMDELCARVDVLSVHVSLLSETVNLAGEQQIRAMRRGSILVSTARKRWLMKRRADFFFPS